MKLFKMYYKNFRNQKSADRSKKKIFSLERFKKKNFTIGMAQVGAVFICTLLFGDNTVV